MIVGPTETPDVHGPFREESRAEAVADRWNRLNPAADDDPEPYYAWVAPLGHPRDLFQAD